MSGWKDWEIGEVVTEGEFQSFVQDQVVQRYADSAARTSALGTAVAEGMVSYLDDSNKVEVYNGTAWTDFSGDITAVTAGTGLSGGGTAGDVTLSADYAAIGSALALTTGTAGFTALSNGTAGISYQPVSHNYIINGAMDVWQRGNGPFTTVGGYTADRWRLSAESAVLSTDVPNASFVNSLKLNSTTAFSRMEYRMESTDSKSFTQQPFTLSFWIKANEAARTNGRIELRYPTAKDNFGTTTFVNSYSLTSEGLSTANEWIRLDLGPIGPNANFDKGMAIWFYAQLAPTDTVEYYLTGVQLEAGGIATPFKRHAPSLQGELAACQRYYWRWSSALNNFTQFLLGYNNGTTTMDFPIFYPVTMRKGFNSANVSAPADFYIEGQGASGSGYTFSVIDGTEQSSQLRITGFTGLTASLARKLRANNTPNAYIQIEAEL